MILVSIRTSFGCVFVYLLVFHGKKRPGKRNSVNFIQELQEAQTIDKMGRGLVFIYSRFQAILQGVPKTRNLHK